MAFLLIENVMAFFFFFFFNIFTYASSLAAIIIILTVFDHYEFCLSFFQFSPFFIFMMLGYDLCFYFLFFFLDFSPF